MLCEVHPYETNVEGMLVRHTPLPSAKNNVFGTEGSNMMSPFDIQVPDTTRAMGYLLRSLCRFLLDLFEPISRAMSRRHQVFR